MSHSAFHHLFRPLGPSFLAVLLLIPALAHAQAEQATPVIFSRSPVTIVPAPAPTAEEPPAPAKTEETAKPAPPAATTAALPARVAHRFMVDIRPEADLYSEGLFNLASIADSQGLMYMLPAIARTGLRAAKIYAPVDVMFIDAEGKILQIAPSVALSQLQEPLESRQSCAAFLLLKAGSAAGFDIRPGDYVQHPNFTRKPIILQ